MRTRSLAVGITLGSTILGVLSLAACELLLPTKALDAPPDAGPAAVVDTCVLAVPPGKPDAAGAPPGSLDLVFAVQSFELGGAKDDAGADLDAGFDLDGVCTSPSGGDTCRGASGKAHPDGPGGQDLAGSSLFGGLFGQVLAGTEGTIDDRIARGETGYLVGVSGYNGGANDDKVQVTFYDSSGLLAPDAGGFSSYPPSWNGTDEWSVDCKLSNVICDGKRPFLGDKAPVIGAFVDPNAYVTEHVLVAHVATLDLGIGLMALRLTDTIISGTLSQVDGTYRLDGQIAGHIKNVDFFDAIATVRIGGSGSAGFYACGDALLAQADYLRTICAANDIRSEGNDASAPCNSTSFAIPFTALPARFGYWYNRPPPNHGPCDAGIDYCAK